MSGTELAIGALALGAASAGMSAAQSYATRESSEEFAEASAAAQRKAAKESMKGVREAEAAERLKAENRAHLIRSQIRVAAGESGIGLGGTYEALMREADYDEYMNVLMIRRNAEANLRRIAAGLSPVQTAVTSPFFSGLQGGMAGVQTALNIGASIKTLQASKNPADGDGGGGE